MQILTNNIIKRDHPRTLSLLYYYKAQRICGRSIKKNMKISQELLDGIITIVSRHVDAIDFDLMNLETIKDDRKMAKRIITKLLAIEKQAQK